MKTFFLILSLLVNLLIQAQKVYSFKYANQADMKIYFVKYPNQAGWNNMAKKHLMY
jgi:hypothetical protein